MAFGKGRLLCLIDGPDFPNIERMKIWLEAHDYDIGGSYSRYPENVNYLCLPR